MTPVAELIIQIAGKHADPLAAKKVLSEAFVSLFNARRISDFPKVVADLKLSCDPEQVKVAAEWYAERYLPKAKGGGRGQSTIGN